jgi:hypothetical protein
VHEGGSESGVEKAVARRRNGCGGLSTGRTRVGIRAVGKRWAMTTHGSRDMNGAGRTV